MMPCSTCESVYGSDKCCDVQCVQAPVHSPKPYLHHAGRPSRASTTANSAINTTATIAVRRVNNRFSASCMVTSRSLSGGGSTDRFQAVHYRSSQEPKCGTICRGLTGTHL